MFLDTAPLIYFLDKNSPLCPTTAKMFSQMVQNDYGLFTSSVTCMEYLVYPYKNKDDNAVNIFWDFLGDANIYICNINKEIAEKAARIRAEYQSFKAFDSLQLASACSMGCDLFLTNDKQLRQFEEIQCITVEDWPYGI